MDFGLAAQVGALLPDMIYILPYFGEIDLAPYVVSGLLFLGLIVVFKLIEVGIISRLRTLSERTHTDVDDMLIRAIGSIRMWVYVLVAFYIALQSFTLPGIVSKLTTLIFLGTLVWQAIEVVVVFIDYTATRFLEKDEDGDGVVDPNAATASHMVTLLARVVLWALGALFVLSNLGIEITSLIAGLGIGGIAVAFALQGILSDLFSSFSLYFDRPFRIGDFIVIGEHSGTVEKIGIKTTRIRTLQGEELVVSNAELTTTRVQNFKKMKERRIAFTFGITYETPHEKVVGINKQIEELFATTEGARLDRAHFTSFGDSALMFEVVYYVASSDYTEYLNVQQSINHGLMRAFAATGIEFAYPTQTLYVKK